MRLVTVAFDGLMQTVEFDAEAMATGADDPLAAATDVAEWLVKAGMPFRDAHALVAGLVRQALAESFDEAEPVEAEPEVGSTESAVAPQITSASDRLTELVAVHPALGPEAARLLRPGAAYLSRNTPGASGPDAVAVQLARLHTALVDAGLAGAGLADAGREPAGSTDRGPQG